MDSSTATEWPWVVPMSAPGKDLHLVSGAGCPVVGSAVGKSVHNMYKWVTQMTDKTVSKLW